jgi:hypothetical protein
MAQRGRLRASDADREHVAERLRHAAAEGRLLAHELEERMAIALRARTYGELDEVVADLPVTSAGVVAQRRRSGMALARPALALALAIPIAFVLIAAVLFVVTGFVAVWMLWVALGWFAYGRKRRHYAARGGRPAGMCAARRPPHQGQSYWL